MTEEHDHHQDLIRRLLRYTGEYRASSLVPFVAAAASGAIQIDPRGTNALARDLAALKDSMPRMQEEQRGGVAGRALRIAEGKPTDVTLGGPTMDVPAGGQLARNIRTFERALTTHLARIDAFSEAPVMVSRRAPVAGFHVDRNPGGFAGKGSKEFVGILIVPLPEAQATVFETEEQQIAVPAVGSMVLFSPMERHSVPIAGELDRSKPNRSLIDDVALFEGSEDPGSNDRTILFVPIYGSDATSQQTLAEAIKGAYDEAFPSLLGAELHGIPGTRVPAFRPENPPETPFEKELREAEAERIQRDRERVRKRREINEARRREEILAESDERIRKIKEKTDAYIAKLEEEREVFNADMEALRPAEKMKWEREQAGEREGVMLIAPWVLQRARAMWCDYYREMLARANTTTEADYIETIKTRLRLAGCELPPEAVD